MEVGLTRSAMVKPMRSRWLESDGDEEDVEDKERKNEEDAEVRRKK